MDLTILKCTEVERALRRREDSVPVVERLFESERILTRLFGPLGIGRNENRDVLQGAAHLADMVEHLDDVSVIFARFMGEIPSGEALVMPVTLGCFFQKRLIDFDFLPPGTLPPVVARVVSSKEDFQVVLVGQGEEKLAQVIVNGKQIGEALSLENAPIFVSSPDDDDRVNSDFFIQSKLSPPLHFPPVLAGDVVGDLIKECPGDSRQSGHRYLDAKGLVTGAGDLDQHPFPQSEPPHGESEW